MANQKRKTPKKRKNGQLDKSAPKRRAKRGAPVKGLEIFAGLPPPPIGDPLKLASWAQEIAAKTLEGTIRGTLPRDRGQEIRACVRTICASMPLERIHRAEEAVKGDQERMKPKGGPEPKPVQEDGEDIDPAPLRG